MAEKPKKNFLTDTSLPLKGIDNILSGKVFDPKSWIDEDETPTLKGADDDEQVEETTTRTVRRGKRGTFASAPSKPATGDAGNGGDGTGEAGKGTAAGEQDKK